MSITETPDPTETDNDDVTPDETEASENFDLASIGITDALNMPFEELLSVYREQVEICNTYLRKLKQGTSDPNDVTNVVKKEVATAKKEDEQAKQFSTVGESFTKAFFEKTPVTSSLLASATLLDELENLLSLVKDEYTYHFNAEVQRLKDERGIKSTPAESAIRAKLACIKLKGTKPGEGMINVRIQYDKIMGKEIPENLYKTGGQRNGFDTDVVPRLPKLNIEGPIEGNSTHLVFRFQATGSDEVVNCSETTLNDVAHNVLSSGAYRVTGKQVERDLKKAKFGIGATQEEWSLVYETGTLFGKLA